MKATRVDGVYDADPAEGPDRPSASSALSYAEALQRTSRSWTQTAIALCRENKLPIVVFDMTRAREHPARSSGRDGRHARHGLSFTDLEE